MIYDIITPGTEPPAVGDILVSARLVRIVTDVRPVESRVWHDRWRIELRRLGPVKPWPTEAVQQAIDAGGQLRHAYSYRSGEGPADVARQNGLPVRAG